MEELKPTNINNFMFRKAENEDADKIRNLIFNTLIEHGLTPDPEHTDRDLYNLKKFYENGYFGIICDTNQNVFGSFALFHVSKSTAEVRKMYLSPSARKIGLGIWMINFLIDMSRHRGYKVLELETVQVLNSAVNLYLKMGFVFSKSKNKSPRCDIKMLLNL